MKEETLGLVADVRKELEAQEARSLPEFNRVATYRDLFRERKLELVWFYVD